MRREKMPTKEVKERFEDGFWVCDVLRVFVDASELKKQRIFGLGVILCWPRKYISIIKKALQSFYEKINLYSKLVAEKFAMIQLG